MGPFLLMLLCAGSPPSLQSTGSLVTLLGVAVTLVMFGVIVFEMRAMKRTQKLIQKNTEITGENRAALEGAMSIMKKFQLVTSQVLTDAEDIMTLAVKSTEKAEKLYALGTISSLALTERLPGETQEDHELRRAGGEKLKVDYVKATRDLILRRQPYRRIMSLLPRDATREACLEVLANVRFFKRIMEEDLGDLDLIIYHSPAVGGGKGDFHFRCTQDEVILRVGGHGNPFVNAAIRIVNPGVTHQFRQYFESLVQSPNTRALNVGMLSQVEKLLLEDKTRELARLLGGQHEEA